MSERQDNRAAGFSREQRLRESRLFEETFNQGQSRAGRFVVLWVRRAADADRRLGVIASRRSFRRAVDRSRAKRLLREAFRLNRHRVIGGCDLVLVARPRILPVKRQDVEKDLVALLKAMDVLATDDNGEDESPERASG